jgi:hypothetical protein
LGCGDFICGNVIYDNLNIKYTGYDTYKKIIDYNSKKYTNESKYLFEHLDIVNEKEKIKNADLCILKDVLQHWSNETITKVMDYLIKTKKFKYIVVCNCCNQKKENDDTRDGAWRPLSCDFLPLKKYCAKKILNYNSKEMSIIEC